MPSREHLLLIGALGLLVVGAFAAGGDVFAEEQPPAPAAAAPVVPAPTAPTEPAPEPAALAHAPVLAAPAPTVRRGSIEQPDVNTRGWTKGVIRGDIQLAVAVIDRIREISVEVSEARTATSDARTSLPSRFFAKVTRGLGTPTFELQDVPFSPYPYIVRVIAPGLNGSHRTITVDAQQPLVDDIVLTILPGAPLSVLVRDQEQIPYTGLDIALLGVGDPAGRPTYKGHTDNFGSLVFEEVLAGDYQVFATQSGIPLIQPMTITVQAGGPTRVTPQSLPLVIERGVAVHVTVHDRNNYPFVETKVTAQATDRSKLLVKEAFTDHLGIATFPFLPPGTWQLTVAQDKHYQWDQQITLKPHQDPLYVNARLVPALR